MTTNMAEFRDAYNHQGYLSALPVLDETELREARQAFAELEKELGEEYTQYSLHNVHLTYTWVMNLAKHPRALSVINAVLGPDVILLDSRFICKYPVRSPAKQTGSDVSGIINNEEGNLAEDQQSQTVLPFVAWHQDMKYWGIDGGPVLSVWLALDDSLPENGALQVIPGSHCSGLLPHHLATRPGNMLSVNQEIPAELVEADKKVICPLLAGQMSIHDGLLVHASDPNMSQKRRCGLVVRYVPTFAYPIQDPARPRTFNATVLASGTDCFNHFPCENPQL